MCRLLPMLVMVVLLGCGSGGDGGDDSGDSTDGLAGDWDLVAGGGQSFMHLEQDGATISGESCEGEGKDCYPLQEGSVAGTTLTFFFSFVEAGTTHRVDGSFIVSDGGNQLAGELVSSKCDCTLPHTYERRSL